MGDWGLSGTTKEERRNSLIAIAILAALVVGLVWYVVAHA